MIQFKDYKNFISKDETRAHLGYAHVMNKAMVITDGHRLLKVNTSLDDGVYDVKSLGLMRDIDIYKEAFSIIPSDNKRLIVDVKVPKMLGQLKTTGISRYLTVYIDDKGVFHIEKPEKFLAAYNPIFFREIADMSVVMSFAMDHEATSAAMIHLNDGDQTLLIMPKRV